MKFENGWTISVQWGIGNYCDMRDGKSWDTSMKTPDMIWESPNAEIAIWKDDSGESEHCYYKFDNGDVCKGWCTPDEVAEWIDNVSRW